MRTKKPTPDPTPSDVTVTVRGVTYTHLVSHVGVRTLVTVDAHGYYATPEWTPENEEHLATISYSLELIDRA